MIKIPHIDLGHGENETSLGLFFRLLREEEELRQAGNLPRVDSRVSLLFLLNLGSGNTREEEKRFFSLHFSLFTPKKWALVSSLSPSPKDQ